MSAIAPYEVSAFNTAVTSENKIHDDDVARVRDARDLLARPREIDAPNEA